MDPVDKIPVRVLHVLEADIAQDTGVIEKHIDATKVLDGGLDDSLTILHTVVVGDRLAASGANLLDDNVCGLCMVSGCSAII